MVLSSFWRRPVTVPWQAFQTLKEKEGIIAHEDPMTSDSGACSALRQADSSASNLFRSDILVVPLFGDPVSDFADRVLTESA